MSVDSRWCREALMLLAWRWRGDLPLAAKHVEGLIDQVMNCPVSGPAQPGARHAAGPFRRSQGRCRISPAGYPVNEMP